MSRRTLLSYAAVATGGLAVGYLTYRATDQTPAPALTPAGEATVAAPRVDPPVAGSHPGRVRPAQETDVGDKLSPRGRAYDAVYTAAYLNLPVVEVFEREARVQGFADRREAFLRQAYQPLLGELVPTATVSDVECRTGCCLVHLRAPQSAWSKAVQFHLGWGDLVAVASHVFADGGAGYVVTACSSRETSEHDYFEGLATTRLAQIAPDLRALRDAASVPKPDGSVGPKQ